MRRVVAFAPGRVNLIGEHTDYNQGLALPFAIEQGVTVTATELPGRVMEVAATDLGEIDAFPLGAPPRAAGWRAFVRGTVAELQRAGLGLVGARLEITSTVPVGSGLGSSAALEVALALALVALAGHPEPDRVELARLCSRVENEWVGARTGLLDQLACLMGSKDHALQADFRLLELSPVPLELGSWRLVLLHSGEGRTNRSSGYNRRREECAAACGLLEVESLREANMADADRLSPPLNRRVSHVVEENRRVLEAAEALNRSDLVALGALIDSCHASLRDLYEVSTAAADDTVTRLKWAGAAGARLMGGGFGGYILGLMPPHVAAPPGALDVRPSRGATVLLKS